MKYTMTEYDFIDAFSGVGSWSDTYKNNFSYSGLKALFGYIQELEESIGEDSEFDRVGIACDYAEYTNVEFLEAYSSDFKTNSGNVDFEKLADHTAVIPIKILVSNDLPFPNLPETHNWNTKFIIQQF